MKHLFVHDLEGRILAIVESTTTSGPRGTRSRIAAKPPTKGGIAEIELTEAHRSLPLAELIETLMVDASGASPMLRPRQQPR